MDRVPEPELMLDDAQASAYAHADFTEPHARFVALLRERHADLPATGRGLDLGCGPGDVTLRLARALPGWTFDAIDGSPAMLALARRAAEQERLAARVRFQQAVLPDDAPPASAYDLVAANSLLHHLRDPAVLWASIRRFGAPRCRVLVMDLLRPDTCADARALVARYAASEPEVLRTDFYNSLCAAYRPEEIRAQLVEARLAQLAVEVVSDRHWIVSGRLAPPDGTEAR